MNTRFFFSLLLSWSDNLLSIVLFRLVTIREDVDHFENSSAVDGPNEHDPTYTNCVFVEWSVHPSVQKGSESHSQNARNRSYDIARL